MAISEGTEFNIEAKLQEQAAAVSASEGDGWSEWFAARLRNNGGAKEALRPTLSGRSHDALRPLARGDWIEWELRRRGDDSTYRGAARRNGAGNFYLRRLKLDGSWPSLPNGADYEVRVRPLPAEAASAVAFAAGGRASGSVSAPPADASASAPRSRWLDRLGDRFAALASRPLGGGRRPSGTRS